MRSKAVSVRAMYSYLALFFLCSYILIDNGRFGGDGLENYFTAESIVLDGNLKIHNKPFAVAQMRDEARGVQDAAGNYYSPYGIGMPLLLVPFYVVGHLLSRIVHGVPHDYLTQFAVSWSNAVLTALCALALFAYLRRLKFSLRTSFLATLCFGFCTIVPVYVRSGFSEPAIALCLMLMLLCVQAFEQKPRARLMAGLGSIMGYAVLIKTSALLYLPLVAAFLIYKSASLPTFKKKAQCAVAFLIPLSCSAIIYFFTRPPAVAGESTLVQPLREVASYGVSERFLQLKGFFYYLFSPGKGFFFYNVPLALGFLGIRGIVQRDRRQAIYLLLVILSTFIFYSYRLNRGSLFSWGPRYLYVTIPLWCVFVAEFIERAGGRAFRAAIATMMWTGFLVQLPCLCISFSNYLFFLKEKIGIQEYLINFVPELSPIFGSWFVFLSAFSRALRGVSLMFVYNPDPVFVVPVVQSLKGYDQWDVWWHNVLIISPHYAWIVVAAVCILFAILVYGFFRLRSILVR